VEIGGRDQSKASEHLVQTILRFRFHVPSLLPFRAVLEIGNNRSYGLVFSIDRSKERTDLCLVCLQASGCSMNREVEFREACGSLQECS
jgi:hypothetical protein